MEAVDPWTKVTKGLTESFSAFADRLLKAIQGSDLPKSAQGPVIMDCLWQQSLLEEWLTAWGISHSTGIPGDSQGQVNHGTCQSPPQGKDTCPWGRGTVQERIPVKRQAEILAKAIYALNHFECGDCSWSPIQKHWQPKILSEGPPVKVKADSVVWEVGWMILVWERGYAAVKHCKMGKNSNGYRRRKLSQIPARN